MKKIFTLFAALMMVLSMNAATKTIYCKMAQSWWKADGAAVGAYYWGTGAAPSWPGVRMTPVAGETDLWSIDLDTDQYQNIIFTRVNGSGAVQDWGTKTGDLVIPTDAKNLFTITNTTASWGGGCVGNWSVYAPDAPKTYKNITITVIANATPRIYWWDAGDKLADANWDSRPDMAPAGDENTYSFTLENVDEVQGVKYIITVGDVQSADQHTTVDATKNFKELLPQVSVMGVTSWDGDKMTVADDYLSTSVTLALDAAKDYELKLTIDGQWYGGNTIAITKDNNSASFAENGEGNGKITTDEAGDYVFTYTYATQMLEVTYPAPAVVTYMVHAMSTEGGYVEGVGIYEAGSTATLTAVAEEGYQFVNWTINEVEVSTEPTYSFIVTEEVTLFAHFKQTAKTVTLSYEVAAQDAIVDHMTTRTVSVWNDPTYGTVSIAIDNFAEGITEYDLAKVTITNDEYDAVATYSKDEENNKETYHATAYSYDSLTIYDITFVVATKEIKQYSLYSTTAIVTILEMDMGEGEKAYTYSWTNSAEEADVYELYADSNEPPYYYVGGTINGVSVMGDLNVVAGHDEEGAWLIADAKDYDGNIYHINLSGPLPKTEEPEVEKEDPVYTDNNLNPYAFGLTSKLSDDKSTLTVNYRLNNSKATDVDVIVKNGQDTVIIVSGTTNLGKNTVEISTEGFPGGVELTWAVIVNGTSVESPTQESKMYSLYCPHGLAIDKDPESENFGRILVADAMNIVKDKSGYLGSGIGAGLHAFNPSFTTDSTVYTGGNDFTRILASNGYQPWRVKISEDGRIFVSSLDLNGVVVWEVSKDLQTWTPVISGTHDATDHNIYDAAGNFIAGPNCSMDVVGSGENLKLLLYSTNNKGIAFNQSGYRLDEYALGTATTWTGTPKNILEGGKYGVVHTNVEWIYDGEGGYWFGGSRAGNAGQANLAHINAEGVEDYRSEDASLYGGDGVLLHDGMLIKGKARTSSTVGNIGFWTVSKDENGAPVLTEKWVVAANGIGRNLNEFAVDYANNLYAVGNSGEKIIAYALPYSGEVVTPAASKYAFQLEGTASEYEVYEDEITNLAIDYDNLLLIGGPSTNFQVEVVLGLGEYNMNEDKFQLLPESSISVLGSEATFVEGWASVDGIDQTANAVVRCLWNEMALEFHLSMSAAPLEATVVVVENAAIEIEKYLLFGDMYDYALKMTGVWNNEEDGLAYPVLVEVPVYYPEATEPYDMYSTVTVGGMGEDDPWLGFGEGYLTITQEGDKITATGIVENPMVGIAIDITISGSLSQGPGTGLENATVVIKSIKKIQNGQLIIEKDGVQYNAQGAILK